MKMLSSFLKPFQKKEVLKRIILENKENTEEEKKELWSKLDTMTEKEICIAWNNVIESLEVDL